MAEGVDTACRGCGKPLDPRAATCASCGRFIDVVSEKQKALQPSFALPAAAIVGGVIGLVGTVVYTTVLLALLGQLSPQARSPDEFGPLVKDTWWVAALFTIGIVLPLGGLYFMGIRLGRIGRPVEATFVLAAAIGATFPASACDVGILSSIGH